MTTSRYFRSPRSIRGKSFAVAACTLATFVLTIGPTQAATKRVATKKTSKVHAPSKIGPEVSPAGDIPDNQAFVAYVPKSGGYVVSVPEGWARTESGTATSFTDKLNTIRMDTVKPAAAPTTASIVSVELAAVKAVEPKVTGGKASQVTRKAGAAVVVKYQRDGAANAVTGKIIREDVERYEFWRNDTEVILTLSGPVGADNVDPWKIVTDSFSWK